jgi:hypothetical protein
VEPYARAALRGARGENDMTSNSKTPLKPEDFPADAEDQKIKKQDGTPIADAESPAVATESQSALTTTKPGAKKTSGQPEGMKV